MLTAVAAPLCSPATYRNVGRDTLSQQKIIDWQRSQDEFNIFSGLTKEQGSCWQCSKPLWRNTVCASATDYLCYVAGSDGLNNVTPSRKAWYCTNRMVVWKAANQRSLTGESQLNLSNTETQKCWAMRLEEEGQGLVCCYTTSTATTTQQMLMCHVWTRLCIILCLFYISGSGSSWPSLHSRAQKHFGISKLIKANQNKSASRCFVYLEKHFFIQYMRIFPASEFGVSPQNHPAFN